jgi:hypothetical protein
MVTLNIMALSKMPLSIATLNMATLNIMTLSKMPLSTVTLSMAKHLAQ